MDGSYGLIEEITRAHQQELLAEAARDRTAGQAMYASTSQWRLVLRADIGQVIEGLARRSREVPAQPGVADSIPVAAS